LPRELDGAPDEIHVHFPWGSLLKAFSSGDVNVLQNVRRICASGALLEVVIGLDRSRDLTGIIRLGLDSFSLEYIDNTCKISRGRFLGLPSAGLLAAEWPEFKSSWAKRLKGKDTRPLT
jgi:hypothetical protein